MEERMETTKVYWGYMGIMEEKKWKLLLYGLYKEFIGIMEKSGL